MICDDDFAFVLITMLLKVLCQKTNAHKKHPRALLLSKESGDDDDDDDDACTLLLCGERKSLQKMLKKREEAFWIHCLGFVTLNTLKEKEPFFYTLD